MGEPAKPGRQTHTGHGEDRGANEGRIRRLVGWARSGRTLEVAEVDELLAIASERSGPVRKVALEAIGTLCKGDRRVALELAVLLDVRATEPWINHYVVRALMKIGVADPAVIAALTRIRYFNCSSRAAHVQAKKALAVLAPNLHR